MMKRLAATALALSLLGGASALAQSNSSNPHSGSGWTGGSGGAHTGGSGGTHTGGTGGTGGAGGAATGGAAAAGGSQAGSGGPRTGAFTGYPGGWRGGQGGAPHGGSNAYTGGQGSGSPGGSNAYQGGGNPHGGYHGQDWRGGGNNPGDRGEWRSGRGGDRHDEGGQHHGFNPGFGAPGYQPGGERPHYSQRYFPHSFSLDHRHHWRGDWRAPRGFYNRHWNYGDHLPWGWFTQSYWIDDYYDYDLPVPPYGYEWIRVGDDAVLVDLSSGMVVETVTDAFY